MGLPYYDLSHLAADPKKAIRIGNKGEETMDFEEEINKSERPILSPEQVNYKLTIRHPMRQFEFAEIEARYPSVPELMAGMENLTKHLEGKFPANNLGNKPPANNNQPPPQQQTHQIPAQNQSDQYPPTIRCKSCMNVIPLTISTKTNKPFWSCKAPECTEVAFWVGKTKTTIFKSDFANKGDGLDNNDGSGYR